MCKALKEARIRRVDPKSLTFGKPLAFNLYDADGRYVMRAGQILEPIDLKLAEARLINGLFTDAPAPGKASGDNATTGASTPTPTVIPVSIPVRTLVDGMTFPHPLYDDAGTLLLSADRPITAALIERFRARGVMYLTSVPNRLTNRAAPDKPLPAAKLETPATRELDQLLEHEPINAPLPALRPRNGQPGLALLDLREHVQAGARCYERTLGFYADFATDLRNGQAPKTGLAGELVGQMMDLLGRDRSLPLLLLDLKDGTQDYVFRHGLNVALVSMAVASHCGWPQHQVLEVGLGALLQDVGMLSVPESIRHAPRPLTPQERSEVERHPIYSLNTLEKCASLSKTSLLIAYQAHERCDCSGYPRKRHKMFIHPLARIVNAADMFAAVTSDRPHRKAATPYTGMATLLKEAQAGRLDRDVVRAFLDCLSLFPVGSYVKLSDGTLARVLRSNGGQHTKPVVVPLNRDGSETDHELDLSKSDTLKVIATLEAGEVPRLRRAG